MEPPSDRTGPREADSTVDPRPKAKARRFQRDMSAPLQDYRFEVGRPDHGERLDSFLSQRVRWRSRSQIQTLIQESRVEALPADSDGRSLRPATRLRAGQEVVLWLDGPSTEDSTHADDQSPTEIETVFDDPFLLGVNKPAGVSLYPTRGHRDGSLIEKVHRRHRLRGDHGAPPSPCHRLDRETSGVLLFARDVVSRAAIGEQIEQRRITKTYLALVRGVMESQDGVIDLALGADPASKVRLKQAAVDDGQPATTRWQVRERLEGQTLVELTPVTGRQHQLRAHLAAIGHPIVGDKLYLGGDEVFLRSVEGRLTDQDNALLGCQRQALHAWRLELCHPDTGEGISIEAALPRDLEDLLSSLG